MLNITALLVTFALLCVCTFSILYFTKSKVFYFYTAVGAFGLLMVCSILELAGVLDSRLPSHFSLISILFSVLVLLACLFRKHFKDKLNTQGIRFSIKTIIVITLLELFIFNIYAYQTTYSSVEENALSLDNATITKQSDHVAYEFEDVNTPVKTIAISLNSTNVEKVIVDFADETYQNYRTNLISFNPTYQKVAPINASGDISKLRIKIYSDKKDIKINEISINTPIPLAFSLVRVFALFGIVIGIYALKNHHMLNKKYIDNRRKLKTISYALTAVLIIIAFGISVTRSDTLAVEFSRTSGNQITQSLVDAFKNGQFHLLQTPSDSLLALDNPYDWSQRDSISYLWDHLLFEGKYYSYYGIAPVILLFLPYHLLTGFYFPTVWSVFLFGAIGIFFLSKTLLEIISRFFPKTEGWLVVSSLLLLQINTGIWFCFPTPNFYEIAQTAGFAFTCMGSFFIIKSGVLQSDKFRLLYLTLSGVAFSLSVLSRPTLAIYCICTVVIILFSISKTKTNHTSLIKYLLAGFLPYIIIGGFQCYYNYARFGSIIDFGIQYSLTINDFTKSEFHWHYVVIGFFNYFFALPKFTPNFPFITSQVETLNPNGYYFVATNTAIGLVFKAMPILAFVKAKKALSLIPKTIESQQRTLILTLVSVISPFIIVFSIWESGYGVRYMVDFAWQILLSALIICFILYSKSSKEVRRIFKNCFIITLVIGCYLNFAQVFQWYYK